MSSGLGHDRWIAHPGRRMSPRSATETHPHAVNLPHTGIACIDEEHRWLASLVAKLREDFACRDETLTECGCGSGQRRHCDRQLGIVLSDLLGYAMTHFASEERLMVDLPREQAFEHKHEHAEIVARLAAVAERGASLAVVTTPAQLERLITQWLSEHVRQFDLPLARRLTQSAARAAALSAPVGPGAP